MHDESPVWIAVNGVRTIMLSCSPHDTVALATGHLIAEGWVHSPADLRKIDTADMPAGTAGVLVEIDADDVERMQLLRQHRTLHGCGLRHTLDCDPFAVPRLPERAPMPNAVPLLRELFARADADTQDGGIHAAALASESKLEYVAYDVARHCAVDRVIGAAALAGADLAMLGLVCTARVSGAMALKAARARIGWIASRSIATSLARELAARHNVQLAERAGGRRRA